MATEFRCSSLSPEGYSESRKSLSPADNFLSSSFTENLPSFPLLRAGFSLMEILIVLAIFALAGGLVVMNFDTLIDSYNNKSAEVTLWEALGSARSEAIALQKSTQLSFDSEKQIFKIEDLERNLIKEYPLKDQSPLKLTFHARLPSKSLDEARHPKPSDEKIPYILFTSQGYSPPAIITVEQNNIFKRLILDPFSNGEVFEETSPTEP